MEKRTLFSRPNYLYDSEQDVSANYYPVGSAISIFDEERKVRMTLMNDRSQGGSSLQDGQLELMLNRRLRKDDAKGVDAILNETDSTGRGITVPGIFYLQIYK